MKKRTAILLSGALLCSMGGYVAWCFRAFYLPPPLTFVGDISPGAREAMEEWRRSDLYAEPLGFTWTRAWRNLRQPWDCVMANPVEVEEKPESGLWATDIGRWWSFSKTGGRWDASTAVDRGTYFFSPLHERIYRQGEIASRIDAMGANGATIEVLSLGGLTPLGAVVRQATEAADPMPYFPSIFDRYELLGSVTVVDPRDRQHLLDSLARSIREADIDSALPGWGISPRHGIIVTTGDVRAEYLVNFDDGDGYAFGHGIDGIEGFSGTGYPSRAGRSEDLAFFRVSHGYGDVFDTILDKHGIERAELQTK